MSDAAKERFAGYVATLGRGPGRSRALTREEAADAMRLLLDGAPDPMQTGAFLMLLRYRGEDPAEIAGMVEGAAESVRVPDARADLDWPSYGAGRTRGAPWFLLAALALAGAGISVLMHGTNEFTGGITVEAALASLGRAPSRRDTAADDLARHCFAYLPAGTLSPELAALLAARRLLGLRSPINTVARLLNPAAAPASVDGVFHPPYIETHLRAAELLHRKRLLVLKGGGGEAERNPHRPTSIHLWTAGEGMTEQMLPALAPAPANGAGEPDIAALWHGAERHATVEARIVATIALGLIALGRGGDAEAAALWKTRFAHHPR